jgi:hypothetical protein
MAEQPPSAVGDCCAFTSTPRTFELKTSCPSPQSVLKETSFNALYAFLPWSTYTYETKICDPF